ITTQRAIELLEPKRRILQTRLQIRQRTTRKIIDANHVITLRQQTLTQMRTDKTGSTGHTDLPHETLLSQSSSVGDSGVAPGSAATRTKLLRIHRSWAASNVVPNEE